MQVWVAMRGEFGEGGRVIGVFSSEEAAKQACEKEEAVLNGHDAPLEWEREKDGEWFAWIPHPDWVYVRPWMVRNF